MHTKILMQASALAMLLAGLALTFAPQELITSAGATPQAAIILLVQAAGALYLGFAILNWMAKDNLIGGIYSRPVALGNFLHFFMATTALGRAVAASHHSTAVLALTIVYAIFAAWFAWVLFGNPAPARA